jgi:hypothetical protein
VTTNVELSDDELAELKALTRESTAAAAVHSAILEYLKYGRRMELISASGRVQMEDNWQHLESLELRDSNGEAECGVEMPTNRGASAWR